jgi:phosphate starvation-inducible PhoH-like protein
MNKKMEKRIFVDDCDLILNIFGIYDTNVHRIEESFSVSIRNENHDIVICGENENSLEMAFRTLFYLKKSAILGQEIDEQKTSYAIDMISDGRGDELDELEQNLVLITPKGKPIKTKTVGQKKYLELIKKNTVIFGIGPAGTGKTFLAVAAAVAALREKKVTRIILTRPAVEAGERLGYLPGDLQSKIEPYLRPLYDALYETMGTELYQRNVEKGIIEIAPLAYMRGRTLDDSFVILDEAQNTTPEQMKMFLTRLGFGSKAIITGDLTQTDLPHSVKSGLSEAVSILAGIEDIGIHRFTERDVVRHKLVQKIILAYEKHDQEIQNSSTYNRYRPIRSREKQENDERKQEKQL